MGETKIAWCDKTWNPIVGCTKVSPGCDHCWALRNAWRFGRNPNAKMQRTYHGLALANARHDLMWSGVVRCLPERLDEPLHWREPQRVFVVSQADLFHERVPNSFRDEMFETMAHLKRHLFLTLTKRADEMLVYAEHWARLGMGGGRADFDWRSDPLRRRWPSNVWAGVTCEDQQRADERIPLLLQVPAAVRWVSAEPLLGPLDLRGLMAGLDWVVAGCESGPGARPMDAGWAYSLWTQTHDAGLPFFFKQAMVNGKLDHAPTILGQRWQEFPEEARCA